MGLKCFLSMLESGKYGSCVQDTDKNSIRKTRFKILRTFFSCVKDIQRRFFGLGESGISRTVDEKIPIDVPQIDKVMSIVAKKTREEQFNDSKFEWVKTERRGDVCKFLAFDYDSNGEEYTCFDDGTRVKTDLIGDVVLRHEYDSDIIGAYLIPQKTDAEILGFTKEFYQKQQEKSQTTSTIASSNPVTAILEKSKKKNEKIVLTLTVKIPSVELYSVIRENFDDVDDVILESVLQQVQEKMLKDALKRELQSIYNPKKKKTDGK